MELLLPFNITPSSSKISYPDKILLIGSCFSEEVGNRLHDLKFNVLQNPNGILYDPISITRSLNSYITNKHYCADEFFELNDLWHSWQHHSAFSGIKKEDVIQKINHSQDEAHSFLKDAKWLIVTAGTAYRYILSNSGEPVANCHKAPSSFFTKELLAIEHIVSELSSTISNLQPFNPDLKIIFTISPVRHVRDGVIENNRSKARLIEAVQVIKDQFEMVSYFPAYEIIIDVLRDYRFYKTDRVHPTEEATGFVFEQFCNAYLDHSSLDSLEKIKKLNAAMKHKPFNESGMAHQKFKTAQLENIKRLKNTFPFISFSKEEEYFSNE